MESRKLRRPKPASYLLALGLFCTILFLILGFPRPAQVSQTNPSILDPTFGIGGRKITSVSPLTELRSADKQDVKEENKVEIQAAYGKLPLSFIQNDGQVDEKVKFYEKGNGRATFFTKDGIYLSLTDKQSSSTSDNAQSTLIKLSPIGANKHPKIFAEGMQEGKVNYFIGNDPKKWKTKIPTYQAVVYQEVYPGIDLKFYGNNRQMEYDIIVKPGADPSMVKFAYEGIEGLRLTDEGDLEIGLNGGAILQKKPIVYQEIHGKRVNLAGTFKISSNTNRHPKTFTYGFDVAAHDKTQPLLIDPILVYITSLGGNWDDYGRAIAADASGNAYVTGNTDSSKFHTTPGAFQPTLGDGICSNSGLCSPHAFVTKINADGSAIIYSTYLSGDSGSSFGSGIAVDGSGNAYVSGTASDGFPITPGAFRSVNGGNDFFIAKLSADGSALIYSTYMTGSGRIAVDSNGNAYVTGSTSATDFPTTPGAFQSVLAGDYDAFVMKLNPTGSALVYSTYLGGSGSDGGSGIAVDGSGNAYVTGATSSTDFPTTLGAFQSANAGNGDAFVTKLNSDGSALVYSTYLGGSGGDSRAFIAVDALGNAYVSGTASYDFPTTPGAFQSASHEHIVTKLNAEGSALIYSTYFSWGVQPAFAVDAMGNFYVMAMTSSTDLPTTPGAFRPKIISPRGCGGPVCPDAYVAKLNASGSALVYATYLGGGYEDYPRNIAVDSLGNAYVTGATESFAWGIHVLVAKIGTTNVTIPIGASACVADYNWTCAYNPSPLTINSGDSVAWGSADGTVLHTATSDTLGNSSTLTQPVAPSNDWSTETFSGGGTSSLIGPFINTSGASQTKLYHCSLHPATMKGTLIILTPPPPPTTTTTTTRTSTTSSTTTPSSTTTTTIPATAGIVTIPTSSSACSADYTQNCSYNPNPWTINSGDYMVWKNVDGVVPHTATSDDHGDTFITDQPVAPMNAFTTSFLAGSLAGGTSIDVIGPFINTSGVSQTKLYHCSLHPATMKGTLIINPALPPTTTTTTTRTTTTTSTTTTTIKCKDHDKGHSRDKCKGKGKSHHGKNKD